MTAGDVQMRPCFLWNWRLALVSPQHSAQPVQGFAKIATDHRRQTQVVGDQPNMMLVVAFLGRLQRHAKLALGRSPLTHRHETEAARIAALGANYGSRRR